MPYRKSRDLFLGKAVASGVSFLATRTIRTPCDFLTTQRQLPENTSSVRLGLKSQTLLMSWTKQWPLANKARISPCVWETGLF